MSDDQVSLRPISEADLAPLERLLLDPEAIGGLQWYGWSDPGRLRRKWAENGLLGADQSQLAVESGAACAGSSPGGHGRSCRRRPTGTSASSSSRRRAAAASAPRPNACWWTTCSRIRRWSAWRPSTETANRAEQRALEKCGFTREGVQRSLVFRDGQWRDIVRYSLLRGDARPPAVSGTP